MRAPDLGKSGTEDMNVSTYPREEVAVHVRSSRHFSQAAGRPEHVLDASTTVWAKLELRSGPYTGRPGWHRQQPRRAIPVGARAALDRAVQSSRSRERRKLVRDGFSIRQSRDTSYK